MNVDNLRKLSALLRRDAEDETGIRFDLRTVAQPTEAAFRKWEPGTDCGTTACAMGLAALSGEFPGLEYERDDPLELLDIRYTGPSQTVYGYKKSATLLFGIGYVTSDVLFDPSSYRPLVKTSRAGELEVAARIDYLIEHGEGSLLRLVFKFDHQITDGNGNLLEGVDYQ